MNPLVRSYLFRGLERLRHQVFLNAGTSRAFEYEMSDVEWGHWGVW